VIDLRRHPEAPLRAMLRAMLSTGRNACGFGHRDDRETQNLERIVAERLGKEEALYLPTCTMGNESAPMAFCGPGHTVLADPAEAPRHERGGADGGGGGRGVRACKGKRAHLAARLVDEAFMTAPASLSAGPARHRPANLSR
jgi:threonine aldolase